MSEAVGPGGSVDFAAEVLVSAEAAVTFFLAELTLTWCFLGGSGWGIGTGLVSGTGVGSGFGSGWDSGCGSGVGGVGVGSLTGSAAGGIGTGDSFVWEETVGAVEVGEGSPGPGRRDPRSTISTGLMGGGLWHWAIGRPTTKSSTT
ncbi:MAG: hypothetical protein EBV83_04010 [Verrucomicrobia bacterium]|nr:hypothetical protein [Verrucomicrobiota bacterium]